MPIVPTATVATWLLAPMNVPLHVFHTEVKRTIVAMVLTIAPTALIKWSAGVSTTIVHSMGAHFPVDAVRRHVWTSQHFLESLRLLGR